MNLLPSLSSALQRILKQPETRLDPVKLSEHRAVTPLTAAVHYPGALTAGHEPETDQVRRVSGSQPVLSVQVVKHSHHQSFLWTHFSYESFFLISKTTIYAAGNIKQLIFIAPSLAYKISVHKEYRAPHFIQSFYYIGVLLPKSF